MKSRYSYGRWAAVGIAAWLVALGAASVGAGQISQYGDDQPQVDAVRQAADEGLDRWLDAIPPGDLEHYGFADGSNFDGVTLGQPYRVYTVPTEALGNAETTADISELVVATDMWFVPLAQNGEARCMLTVDLMPDGWRAVSIGAYPVGRELLQLQQQYSDEAGYERAFLRVFQASSDFLLVERDGQIRLAAFESARRMLALEDTRQLLEPTSVTAQLKPVVKRNIEQYQR